MLLCLKNHLELYNSINFLDLKYSQKNAYKVWIFISFYDIPFDVNMPGGLISLNDRIKVDGKKNVTEKVIKNHPLSKQ